MGETPTTTNAAAQTVADIIHFVQYDVAVTLGEAAIVAEVPFLGLPGIRQILHLVLTWIAGKLYVPMATLGIFKTIELQTNAEKAAYAEAESKLRLAHASGDPKQIEDATNEFKKSFRALVHYDGSAHV